MATAIFNNNAAADVDETVFGDLNGPLAFWGPASTGLPTALFTPEEEALLRRLRQRVAGSNHPELADALSALLPA